MYRSISKLHLNEIQLKCNSQFYDDGVQVPTVNPETGVMDPEEEPLRTLKEFHPWASLDGEKDESQKSKGVFGNCMGIVVEGQVDEGDEVWALVSSYEKKVVK